MSRKLPKAGTVAKWMVILFILAVIIGILMGISENAGRASSTVDALTQSTTPSDESADQQSAYGPSVKISIGGMKELAGRYVVDMPGSATAALSIDPKLQKRVESFFRSNKVPFGALVAMEPATGRVLAYVEYSETDPKHEYYSISKPYLAASLFKIITAEAVLSEKKAAPEDVYCYHGGRSRLTSGLLRDNPRRDNRCLTFEQAMGHSTNVVFARIAHKNLTSELLEKHTRSFLFGGRIPFELDVAESIAVIPEDKDEMAKTAAGFGEVRMSPLHVAMMASAVANGGVMMKPFVVEEVRGPDGGLQYSPQRGPLGSVMSSDVAEAISSMMYTTTTEGTGRKAFRVKRGRIDFKRTVPIAGKTGSLAEREPYFKEYTWYAGFGPVESPKIAVAALVINHRTWKTKGSYAAREVLEEFFRGQGVYADARHARRK